jgi:malate permease and related proteins
MDKLTGVLEMIVPVVLMIAAGIICRKRGVIQKPGIAGLKSFVVNLALPAVLVRAFYKASYSLDLIIIAATMFGVCLAALGLGYAYKTWTCSSRRTATFMMSGFEAGMLGYALYTLLFGQSHVTSFATVDLGQVLFVFTVFLTMLRADGTKRVSFGETLRGIVTSPVIIAIALGIIVGATGMGRWLHTTPAGGIIEKSLDFFALPTAAVILLVIGYELEFGKVDLRQILGTVLMRVAIMGVFCVAVLLGLRTLVKMDEHLKWAIILMFTLPPPFVVTIFVDDDRENASVSATLSAYTVLSLILFAVIACFVV